MLTALRPVLSVVEAGVAVAMLVVCYGKAGTKCALSPSVLANS